MVVLIMLVQRVIYPSFLYAEKSTFRTWHSMYTSRVTMVVMPLMLAQMFLAVWHLTREVNIYTIASMLIIVTLWGLTFLWAIPLHGKLDTEEDYLPYVRKLIQMNKYRTVLWVGEWLLMLCVLFILA